MLTPGALLRCASLPFVAPQPRQVLDLYTPKAAGQDGQLVPVVIFVTGGRPNRGG